MSKQKKKLSKKQLQWLRERRIQTGSIALSVLCVAAIGLMGFLNRQPVGRRYTYTQESDIWFVSGGDVAIAAPGGEARTLPQHGAPSVQPSATLTATSTTEPVATATSTSEPSPTPTATPQPRLADA